MSHLKPLVFLFAALANLGISAFAAASDASSEVRAAGAGLAFPLGPPQPSVAISSPGERNAFPADILARMRAGLVAQTENPQSRSGAAARVND